MDLALEVLEWAKGKDDLAEIFYENKTGPAPVLLHSVFEPGPQASAQKNGKILAALNSPAIGRLALEKDKTRPGCAVQKGEKLGCVAGEDETMPVVAPFSGKIIQSSAKDGQNIGYGDAILLVEINKK
ncbi:MAG: hypothetical protein HY747_05255 [Elusimicrobia bacterium]|nr:hypothetical protein [Elusimicrobiota bacterium]